MAGWAGREVILTWNAAEILGVREKSISINGEAIDVTDDDSAGWRELLTIAGVNSVDLGLSGVSKGYVLMADFFAGTRTRAVAITFPDGSILAGNFFLASISLTDPHDDGETFEAQIQSTGVPTWTPYA